MTFKFAVAGALSVSVMMFGAGASSANDLGAGGTVAAPTYQTGYVTTQGRGRGGFRGGGGGGRYYGGGSRRNYGRNVGIGVGALVLGGIIANQSYKSYGYGYGGSNCSRWSYQCNRGSSNSCYNYERYC